MEESLLAQQARALQVIEDLPRFLHNTVLKVVFEMIQGWWKEHSPNTFSSTLLPPKPTLIPPSLACM